MAFVFGIPVMIFMFTSICLVVMAFIKREVLCELVDVQDNCFNCFNKLFKFCVMGASISELLLFDLLWGAYKCL